jgi:hypothetical protein
LVEKFGKEDRTLILSSVTTLYQAIIDTQVDDGFFVKTTNNHKQSMLYLSVFTNFLIKLFEVRYKLILQDDFL